MEIKRFLEKMEEEKQELEKYPKFSEKEKEILFDNIAKKIIFEGEQMQNKYSPPNSKKMLSNQNIPDSFSSLINRAGVKQHMDFVLFAVYHGVINLGEANVNTKDINEEYKLARMKSSNTNVFLNSLIRKGFLMVIGKKEGLTAFTITREGVKYVEDLLKSDEE